MAPDDGGPTDAPAGSGSGYAFDGPGGRESEQARLRRQSALIDPVTDRLLHDAGIGPGMRVLDLGSGAGDVSLLLARIVGDSGQVVGLERDTAAIESARTRVWDAGIDHVTFVAGDISDLDLDGTFDAVVGRLILMYAPDPAAVLARAAQRLAPGGRVVVQEIVARTALAAPDLELFRYVDRIACEAFQAAGASVDMGARLPAIFRAAGLGDPRMAWERVAGAGELARPLTIWCRDVLAGLLGVIERARIASADQLDLATLPDRLDAALEAHGAIALMPPLVGAWTRVGSPR